MLSLAARTLATSQTISGSHLCLSLDACNVSDYILNRGPGLISSCKRITIYIVQNFANFKFNVLPVYVAACTSLWFNQSTKFGTMFRHLLVATFLATWFGEMLIIFNSVNFLVHNSQRCLRIKLMSET